MNGGSLNRFISLQKPKQTHTTIPQTSLKSQQQIQPPDCASKPFLNPKCTRDDIESFHERTPFNPTDVITSKIQHETINTANDSIRDLSQATNDPTKSAMNKESHKTKTDANESSPLRKSRSLEKLKVTSPPKFIAPSSFASSFHHRRASSAERLFEVDGSCSSDVQSIHETKPIVPSIVDESLPANMTKSSTTSKPSERSERPLFARNLSDDSTSTAVTTAQSQIVAKAHEGDCASIESPQSASHHVHNISHDSVASQLFDENRALETTVEMSPATTKTKASQADCNQPEKSPSGIANHSSHQNSIENDRVLSDDLIRDAELSHVDKTEEGKKHSSPQQKHSTHQTLTLQSPVEKNTVLNQSRKQDNKFDSFRVFATDQYSFESFLQGDQGATQSSNILQSSLLNCLEESEIPTLETSSSAAKATPVTLLPKPPSHHATQEIITLLESPTDRVLTTEGIKASLVPLHSDQGDQSEDSAEEDVWLSKNVAKPQRSPKRRGPKRRPIARVISETDSDYSFGPPKYNPTKNAHEALSSNLPTAISNPENNESVVELSKPSNAHQNASQDTRQNSNDAQIPSDSTQPKPQAVNSESNHLSQSVSNPVALQEHTPQIPQVEKSGENPESPKPDEQKSNLHPAHSGQKMFSIFPQLKDACEVCGSFGSKLWKHILIGRKTVCRSCHAYYKEHRCLPTAASEAVEDLSSAASCHKDSRAQKRGIDQESVQKQTKPTDLASTSSQPSDEESFQVFKKSRVEAPLPTSLEGQLQKAIEKDFDRAKKSPALRRGRISPQKQSTDKQVPLLLDDYAFILTSIAGVKGQNASMATADLAFRILKEGGTVIEEPLFKNIEDYRRRKPDGKIVCVADNPARTMKYVLALALGLPRMKTSWLRSCFEKAAIDCPTINDLPRMPQDEKSPYDKALADDCLDIPDNQEALHIFSSKSFLVCGTSEHKVYYLNLLRVLGATVHEKETPSIKLDAVISVGSVSRNARMRAAARQTPIYPVEWIIQCIFHGAVLLHGTDKAIESQDLLASEGSVAIS
eukprot:TRINITY_DN5817_c0_g1_i7.p1 TRINITY_DN5817_c0_g1~~TRINITY_DN5817_c0_g1_i7.p1  ORF type:complete len:1038 (+),score=226.90 TRINITY_DN5817_c0_g1_i7:94-3207(+)